MAFPAAGQEAIEGIRAGSFILQPSLTLGAGFNTNIFIEDTNEESSAVLTASPRLNILSDWNRHELAFSAGANYQILTSSTEDNAFNADAGLSVVLDVTRAVGVSFDLGYQFVSEARGENDTGIAIAEPVTSNNFSGGVGADVIFGRFRVSPSGGIVVRDFKDVALTTGGVDNQDDRDRVELTTGLELGYSLQRGIEAFVQGQYGQIDYDAAVDDGGINRDSDGWRVLAGVTLDLTRLIEARAGVGIENRSFDDPTLGSQTGFSANIAATWFITPLTTLDIGASRSFEETTVTGASVITDTTVQLGVNHELLRNLSLGGTLTYSREAFEDITRRDNLFGVGLNARWQVTRLLSVTPSYQFRMGDSNVAGEDFTDHQFFVRATYGFQ